MVFARKRFGQHFLHDANVIAHIVAAIDPQADDAIVEIGPGHGVLTRPLLEAVAAAKAATHSSGSLDAVEIDRDLAAELRTTLVPRGLTLHEGDALRFDFAALAATRGRNLRVVGNLPYNVSTPLLFHLLTTPGVLQDLHIMLQREVIERMCAAPGSDAYGRLTVMLAPWVATEHLFDVGPGAFRPAPKVWSAVARLTVRSEPAFALAPAFGAVVAAAFSQRRKTLRNALRSWLDADTISTCGVDPGVRPETLTPAQFGRLAAAVVNG